MISPRINVRTYDRCLVGSPIVKMVGFSFICLTALFCLGFDGTSAQEPLFAGSTVVSINDHPYQLGIFFGKNDVCGASIIAPRWAITSAGCLTFKIPAQVNLRAGSNATETGGTVYKVSNFYIHPKFNSTSGDYNVALLNLTRPFVYTRSVKPISVIASNKVVPVGTNTVITGWGYVSNSGPAFSWNNLRKLIMPVISSYACSREYQKKFNPATMICTQNIVSVKGLCSRGGFPMVVNGTLAGVFSWGYGCTTSPPIFTKLSAPTIRSWISSIARV